MSILTPEPPQTWEEYWQWLQQFAPLHAREYEEEQMVHPFCECPFCWNLRKEESSEDAKSDIDS